MTYTAKVLPRKICPKMVTCSQERVPRHHGWSGFRDPTASTRDIMSCHGCTSYTRIVILAFVTFILQVMQSPRERKAHFHSLSSAERDSDVFPLYSHLQVKVEFALSVFEFLSSTFRG
jgi:hypothetical protein